MFQRIVLSRHLLLLCSLIIVSRVAAADTAVSVSKNPKNLLVDNFEDASMKDILGGYIGSDTAVPGTCRFSYTWSQQDTFGRATHSLRVDYDTAMRGSFTYLWFHLGSEGPDKKVQTADLSGFAYLSFWVKALKRGENFKVELHCDTDESGRFDPGEDVSSEVYVDRYVGKDGLADEWRKVVIPLEHFKSIKDFSRVMEVVFVFENSRGNHQGSIFLDDILFGVKKPPGQGPGSAVIPTPTTIVPPDAKTDETSVEVLPELACGTTNMLVARQYPNEYLEGTGFEISWDEGRSWSLAGIDYNARDLAVVSWKTPPLPPSRKMLLRAFAQGINGQRVWDASPIAVVLTGYSDRQFIQDMAYRSFHYFLNNQDPRTGLFLDSTGSNASTAVTGFGLAALVAGAKEGWIKRDAARLRVLNVLRTFADLQQGDGFFYHFMKPRDAIRAPGSEVSVVDTALLMLGALTAGEYFGGEVRTLAMSIFDSLQWDKFYDLQTNSFRMAWTPEKGYSPAHWDYYTDEAVLLHILAAGSTTYPTPADSFYSFRRDRGHYGDGEDFVYSWSGAMFTHQYTSVWLDTQGYQDRQGCDWWENSRKAIAANRDFCWYNKQRPVAYGPHRWGVSSFHRPEGYVMHFGVLPNGSDQAQEDGTISPVACASAITFMPFEAMSDLKHQMAAFPFLLGPYGLRNSYNLSRNWFSNVDFGLDTGLLLLSLENFRNGIVWKSLAKSPVIRRGWKACGFKRVRKYGDTIPIGKAQSGHVPVFPEAPPGASKDLLGAGDLVGKLERLCLRGDTRSYQDFIGRSDADYATARALLSPSASSGQALPKGALLEKMEGFHSEWLRSLIALRQVSVVPMRRHFGKMLQRLRDISPDPSQRVAALRPYLNYVMMADLRDFQEAMYAAFKKEVELSGKGSQTLEAFARQCQETRHFTLAARVWNDALDMSQARQSEQATSERAREIAEGFLKMGRVDEAITFDRMFLRHVTPAPGTVQISKIVGLARRYEAAGASSFSKECYAASSSVSSSEQSEKMLSRLATN